MLRKWRRGVGVSVLVVGLCGCSRIKITLGMRVSLPKVQVASMEVVQYQHAGIGPGETSALIATLTEPDGKELVTEGKGKGKVLWNQLAVATSVVSVNKKGVLTLPRDPRVSDGKIGHLTVTIPSHPGVTAEIDVPLRYDYNFVSNFNGASGSSGSNGSDGSDGSSGSSGSTDPDNPSAGGDGGNGGNGGNGTDGGNGGDAPPVNVVITLRAGAHPLLQVGVTAPGHKERFYLVDPAGGSMTVEANGGNGGSGGSGGRGGNGGSGGSGIPPGSPGSSGLPGSNGSGGSPGNGGQITVTYDASAKAYLQLLHVQAARGPAPVMKEGVVGPLW